MPEKQVSIPRLQCLELGWEKKLNRMGARWRGRYRRPTRHQGSKQFLAGGLLLLRMTADTREVVLLNALDRATLLLSPS
jgi:hypothetical protein